MTTLYEVKFLHEYDTPLDTRWLTEFPEVGQEFTLPKFKTKFKYTVFATDPDQLLVWVVESNKYHPDYPWDGCIMMDCRSHRVAMRRILDHPVKIEEGDDVRFVMAVRGVHY